MIREAYGTTMGRSRSSAVSTSVRLSCAWCGESFEKRIGEVNRQRRVLGDDAPFYCNRVCFGASRRLGKSKKQLIAEKAEYDKGYRAKNGASLKAKKHEYFRRTYDPKAARERRLSVASWHRSYSAGYRARTGWKDHKRKYDKQRRAAEFGTFAECHELLIQLANAVRVQPWYERAKDRGYYDRNPQQRKRNEKCSRW